MSGLRISAISFLNTAPLMWDFEHGDAAKDFEISYTIPSECAAALAANEADIGIIPAITYAEIPGLVILPNIAIAAKDHVRSILLVSKKPWEEVCDRRRRHFFANLGGAGAGAVCEVSGWPAPVHSASRPILSRCWRDHDAALLIGDPALVVASAQPPTISTIWRTSGGCEPASRLSSPSGRCGSMRCIACRRACESGEDLPAIARSRFAAGEYRDRMAREWSPRLGLPEAEIAAYLTQNIHYFLDRENHSGLQLFLRYAHELGLIRPGAGPAVPGTNRVR